MEKKELTLEQIQQGSFEVLKRIKEIFDENGWKYYLTYGTLLGAIRHEGFIPWDDDIDVWVPRDDYEKFISYCKENNKKLKPFELIHYSTNEKYIYPIARFSDTRYYIDYKDAKDYGLGLFVDIYPLDGVCINDKRLYRKLEHIIKNIRILGRNAFIPSKSRIRTILKYPYYLMIKNKNLNRIIEKIDKISQKYTFEKSKYIDVLCWNSNFDRKFTKNMLDDGKNLECYKNFNGKTFRVPYNYDECLKILYGDYMKLPPENERIAHHYYKAYMK